MGASVQLPTSSVHDCKSPRMKRSMAHCILYRCQLWYGCSSNSARVIHGPPIDTTFYLVVFCEPTSSTDSSLNLKTMRPPPPLRSWGYMPGNQIPRSEARVEPPQPDRGGYRTTAMVKTVWRGWWRRVKLQLLLAAVLFLGGEELLVCKKWNMYYNIYICIQYAFVWRMWYYEKIWYYLWTFHWTLDIGYEVTSPDPGTGSKNSGEDELGHRWTRLMVLLTP